MAYAPWPSGDMPTAPDARARAIISGNQLQLLTSSYTGIYVYLWCFPREVPETQLRLRR